jgi:tRNA A-37 threonylcarbamoyl transferase component Bud32
MSPEPLDIELPSALEAYLRATGRIYPREPVKIAVLMGGVSNRTVLVERPSGEAWVLKQALPKLRVAVDWFSDPRRIEREALGIRWLGQLVHAGQITPLIFEDPEHHLLAMEAVPRTHQNWKDLLMSGRGELPQLWAFALLLAKIHEGGWRRREELAAIFDDREFFRSLRLEPYYEYSAAQVPEASPFISALIETTWSRRLTLVHGDYSPKNVLAHGPDIVLLDHEVIHFGDPAFDIGFAMTHLLSKHHHFPEWRRQFRFYADQFWEMYLNWFREGRSSPSWLEELSPHVVRHTLGCLLARVAGRSPLEYLTPAERQRQRDVVLMLMQDPPQTVPTLVDAFTNAIASHP